MLCSMPDPIDNHRPSRRESLAWMLAISVVWIAVYAGCNWITSLRTGVGAVQFGWERRIPFIPWLIVPYMSIDLFFIAAPFVCVSRRQLHVLAARLIAATAVAGFFFLSVPLTLAVQRPSLDGWLGAIYEVLKTGDRPFNMFPSLHAALLLLIWPVYHRATRGPLRAAVYAWFALIMASLLPVYQHHAIDVIGGVLLAALCVVAFPEAPGLYRLHGGRRARIGARYAAAAVPPIALGIAIGPWGVAPGWVGGALALIACGYFFAGTSIFRKSGGRLHAGSRVLLAPYLLGLRATRRYWARRSQHPWSRITESLIVGRRPTGTEARALAADIAGVIDLTAEHDERDAFLGLPYLNIQIMDLTPPSVEHCRAATEFIRAHAGRGTVFVHCGLGYSRSAAIAAAHLIAAGLARSADEAIGMVRRLHPPARLGAEDELALRAFLDSIRPGGAFAPPTP
jgi:protein-tyrosine phosphatase/membrane-associated phospholipid phosphatase